MAEIPAGDTVESGVDAPDLGPSSILRRQGDGLPLQRIHAGEAADARLVEFHRIAGGGTLPAHPVELLPSGLEAAKERRGIDRLVHIGVSALFHRPADGMLARVRVRERVKGWIFDNVRRVGCDAGLAVPVPRGRCGPGRVGEADIEEAFDDATRTAVADQIEAGIDVISDGELRRMRFVYEMYDRLTGLERIAPARRLGVPGYDRAPNFIVRERIAAPEGLGIVPEFRRLRSLVRDRPIKVAFPGPLTFAPKIDPGEVYGGDIRALLADICAIVAAEIADLAAEGATLIQLDEPGFTDPGHGLDSRTCARAVNTAIGGHGDRTAVHICFGNNASRPFAPRSLARLMPGMGELACSMLVLEFANREMADLDLLPRTGGAVSGRGRCGGREILPHRDPGGGCGAGSAGFWGTCPENGFG